MKKNKYLESILDDLIISLRYKGMPKKINEICYPWIYKDIKQNGDVIYKGSLHIRLKK